MTNHTPNTEQREREAFEAWARKTYDQKSLMKGFGGKFVINQMENIYEAWQARATQAAPASPEPAKCECGKNEWRDYYTGPRITHHICIACGFKFPTTQPVFPVPQYRGEISKIEWSEITPGAVHRVASDRAPASPNTGAVEEWQHPTGEAWSAGRDSFLKYARQWAAANTTELASVIADIAPGSIFNAMLATPSPSKGGEAGAAEEKTKFSKCSGLRDYQNKMAAWQSANPPTANNESE